MAQVFAIGDVVNDEEQSHRLVKKEKLPDDYFIIHSFEVETVCDQLFEADICVVAPHVEHLVDAKGIHGKVEVDGTMFTAHRPQQRYRSLLPKLRGKCKAVIGPSFPGRTAQIDFKNICVDTAVVLTIDDLRVQGPRRAMSAAM